MVLPLLYGLSAKDFLEPKGFLLLTCQKCRSSGPFAVFDSKRKVTLYSIPTFSVREQMVLECRSCTQRFAVPAGVAAIVSRPGVDRAGAHRSSAKRELLPRSATAENGRITRRSRSIPPRTPRSIEAAFRRLAMKYHPDTSSDPDARASHARDHRGPRVPERPGAAPHL